MSTAEIMLTESDVEKGGIILPFRRLSDVANHSEWRHFMAERIAMAMDYDLFGVKSVYLIGSVEAGTAGLCSDLDLLVHVEESAEKQAQLELWLDGWSKALALTNYLRTGYLVEDLLDVHIVTDRDVRDNDSFAVKMKNPAEFRRLASPC